MDKLLKDSNALTTREGFFIRKNPTGELDYKKIQSNLTDFLHNTEEKSQSTSNSETNCDLSISALTSTTTKMNFDEIDDDEDDEFTFDFLEKNGEKSPLNQLSH